MKEILGHSFSNVLRIDWENELELGLTTISFNP